MSLIEPTHRTLEPGTIGWSASDLDDPAIEQQWEAGRFEIIEGVLATMPPAHFKSSLALMRLIRRLTDCTLSRGLGDGFASEVDLVLDELRIARVDACFLSKVDVAKQRAMEVSTQSRFDLGRILVSPTLVIESVSLCHEAHDRITKRRWYADAGVPNYWLLTAHQRRLECLRLADGEYAVDADGMNDARISPSLFPGLELNLAELWAE